jgi:hypothetical protein
MAFDVDVDFVLPPPIVLTGLSLNTLDILTSLFNARFFAAVPTPTLLARRALASCASETESDRDLERASEAFVSRSPVCFWAVDIMDKAGEEHRL